MTKFKQGESGNPLGRPAGIIDKRTQLNKLLQPHAEQLINKAIEIALAGDINALRLCLERLIPKIKSESIKFELSQDLNNTESLLNTNTAIIKAVANGEITVEGAQVLSSLIDSHCNLMVVNDYAKRVKTLESTLKERRENEKIKYIG